MQYLESFLSLIPAVPIEHLIAFIALGSIGLAVFALYVVHSLLKAAKRD